jgi:S1-C subfamily serine protease
LPASIRQKLASGQSLGLLVVGIVQGSLAEQADLFVGDILVDIAGKPLNDVATLRATLAENSSQATVRLQVLRGGVLVHVDVALKAQERSAA